MRYFLGVDGGGTGTDALVIDELGRALGRGSGGPSNYHSAGIEVARGSLRDAVRGALGEAGLGPGAIESAFFGLSGVDRPADLKVFGEIISGPGPESIASEISVWVASEMAHSPGKVAIVRSREPRSWPCARLHPRLRARNENKGDFNNG